VEVGARSSAEGAIRVEEPKAPREMGCGQRAFSPHRERGLGKGQCPLPRKNFGS